MKAATDPSHLGPIFVALVAITFAILTLAAAVW
jgi:hypothetical protein